MRDKDGTIIFLRGERAISAYPDFDFEFNLYPSRNPPGACDISVNFRHEYLWKPVYKTTVKDDDAAILQALTEYMDGMERELATAAQSLANPPDWTQRKYKGVDSWFIQLSKTIRFRVWFQPNVAPWSAGSEILFNNRTSVAIPTILTIREPRDAVLKRTIVAATPHINTIARSYNVHNRHLKKIQAKL